MVRRADVFREICRLGDLLEGDARRGWPGIASFESPDEGLLDVFIHAAPVAQHRNSSPNEIKIEPPGKYRPIERGGNLPPIVVGLARAAQFTIPEPVFVAFVAESRVGDNARWNQTFFRPFVLSASERGWAEYPRKRDNGSIEMMYAFHPALLQDFLSLVASGLDGLGESFISSAIAPLAADLETAPARGIVSRTISAHIRDSRFGKSVRDAYGGACAMCDLGLGLVQGAHVHPVSAADSTDLVENGVCLCALHHLAFDRHHIWIDPDSLAVKIHPDIAGQTDADVRFIRHTRERLRSPAEGPGVNPANLRARYEFFAGAYDWAM